MNFILFIFSNRRNDSASESDSGSESGSLESDNDSGSDDFSDDEDLSPSRHVGRLKNTVEPVVQIPADVVFKCWLSRKAILEIMEHPRGSEALMNSLVKIRTRTGDYHFFLIKGVTSVPADQVYEVDNVQVDFKLSLSDLKSPERNQSVAFVSSLEITQEEATNWAAELRNRGISTVSFAKMLRARAKRSMRLEWTEADVQKHLQRKAGLDTRTRVASRVAELEAQLQIVTQRISSFGGKQQGIASEALTELLKQKTTLENQLLEADRRISSDGAVIDLLRLRTKRNLGRQQKLERKAATNLEISLAASTKQDPFARRECRPVVMWDAGAANSSNPKDKENEKLGNKEDSKKRKKAFEVDEDHLVNPTMAVENLKAGLIEVLGRDVMVTLKECLGSAKWTASIQNSDRLFNRTAPPGARRIRLGGSKTEDVQMSN